MAQTDWQWLGSPQSVMCSVATPCVHIMRPDTGVQVRLAKEAREQAEIAVQAEPSNDLSHHMMGRWAALTGGLICNGVIGSSNASQQVAWRSHALLGNCGAVVASQTRLHVHMQMEMS